MIPGSETNDLMTQDKGSSQKFWFIQVVHDLPVSMGECTPVQMDTCTFSGLCEDGGKLSFRMNSKQACSLSGGRGMGRDGDIVSSL